MNANYTDVGITLNQNTTSDSTILIPAGVTCSLTSGTGGPYTITRSSSNLTSSMLRVNGTLTISNLTLDGGAIYSGESDTRLGRSRTNTGITCTGRLSQVIYAPSGSNVTLNDGAVLQNNYISGSSGPYDHGAGILNEGGSITMNDGSSIRNMTLGSGIYAPDGAAFCMLSGNGSFTMNGGTITGNEAGRFGGVCRLTSGTVTINGGTISQNFNSAYNTDNNADTGGGVFLMENGTLNINGGSITGNTTESVGGWTDKNNGGAIHMYGGTVNITGNASITGNTAQGLGGAIYKRSGTLNISGNPTITGNTGNQVTQNIYLLSGQYVTVNGNITGGSVGITADTSRNTAGAQFANGNTYSGLDMFVNDVNSSLFGAAGSNSTVVWSNAVCKIGTQAYDSLSAAITAINNGSATDINGETGTAKSDYKIEMLVENYTITERLFIDDNEDITITTASETGTGPLYRGTSGTFANLNRGNSYDGTFVRVEGILRLDHITLDGGWNSGDTGNDTLIFAYADASVYLNAGSTLKNNAVSQDSGGAIRGQGIVTGPTYIYMNEGALIDHCQSILAGALFGSYKTYITMNGGTIQKCSSTGTTANSASAILLIDHSTFTMTGGSITNNISSGNSSIARGAVNMNTSDTSVVLTGGIINNNSNTYSPLGGGVYNNGGKLTIGGSMQVYGNIANGSSSNVQTTNNILVQPTLSSDLRVGVTYTDHMAAADQFGVISDGSAASAVSGLGGFFNDNNPTIDPDLYGTAGTGSAVVWGSGVCRIGRTIYTTLQAAIEAITAGTETDLNGNIGTSYTDYKIEMLVKDYTLSAMHTFTPGKNIQLTTAPELGFTTTLHRDSAFKSNAMLRTSASNGTLTITNLILDGEDVHATVDDGGAISAASSSNLVLGDGAVIQNCSNNRLYYGTAGIYAGSNVTITMSGSSAIRNCAGNAITTLGKADIILKDNAVIENTTTVCQGLIFLQGTGSNFTMSGNATIQNNTITNTGWNGMLYYAGSGGTIKMMDSSKVINNTGKGTCGGISTGDSAYLILQDNAAITGNTGGRAGGVEVLKNTQVQFSGAVQVTGNKLKDGSASDLCLTTLTDAPLHQISVLDNCEGANIGVKVPSSLHKYYTRFAQTGSATVAASAYDAFFDDLNPHLNIGANAISGNTHTDGYNTYIYFMPPLQFQFYKTINDGNDTPLAAQATFQIYKYTGTGTPVYYDGSADWTAYAYRNQDGTQTTQTAFQNVLATGLVDCGWMEDGTYAIIETLTPDAYLTPLGQWILTVDSEQTTANIFSFKTVHSPDYTDAEVSATMNDVAIIESNDYIEGTATPNGNYSYYFRNNVNQPLLKISKSLSGAYADRTKDFSISVTLSSDAAVNRYSKDNTLLSSTTISANTASVLSLKENEYLIISGMSADSTYTVSETADGYTADITTVLPDLSSSTLNNTKSVNGTLLNGLTSIKIANTYKTVASTGIHSYTYPYLWMVSIPMLILLLYLLNKMHSFKKRHS